MVLNPGAGSADRDALPRRVEARCAAAGRELQLYIVDETHDLVHLTTMAVDAAARERGPQQLAVRQGLRDATARERESIGNTRRHLRGTRGGRSRGASAGDASAEGQ